MDAVNPGFRSPFRRDRDDGSDPDHADESSQTDDPRDGGDRDGSSEPGEPGEWIAYELHSWASENRRMMQQLLTADGVVHSWQGTTLLVHEVLEEVVDALVEEVEDATSRRIEPGETVIGFEMDGWAGELQAELVERLGGAGIPHEIDEDGDLIVREVDEEQVELVIEDVLARADDVGLDELAGLEVNDLLSELFVACDRLRRDPRDADGVLGAVRHGRRMTEVRTPFGFAAKSWLALRGPAGELAEMLEVDGDDRPDDEDIRELAHRLRDSLHPLI